MYIPVHLRTITLTGSHRLISSKISLGCGASARRTDKHLGQTQAESGSTQIHKKNMTPHINLHTKANKLMTSISYKKMHDIRAIDMFSFSLVNHIQFFFVSWSLWKYWGFVIVTRPLEPVASQAPCVATSSQLSRHFFSQNFHSTVHIFAVFSPASYSSLSSK